LFCDREVVLMTNQELIVCIEAEERGEVVQFRDRGKGGCWFTKTIGLWRTDLCEYRVRPRPAKPREWWINVYRNGGAYAHESRELAEIQAGSERETFHVREVTDD